jgi:hypothetical protein
MYQNPHPTSRRFLRARPAGPPGALPSAGSNGEGAGLKPPRGVNPALQPPPQNQMAFLMADMV